MLSIEADNTFQDLHDSSYDTKAKFNYCFIIHSIQSIEVKFIFDSARLGLFS